MTVAFIGMGSNIDPDRNIRAAVRLIARSVRIVNVSTIYRTPPLERPEQAPYWNGVIEIETDIPPAELKRRVLAPIEDCLGRVRIGDPYASRTIDLDLVLYGSMAMNTPELALPDPDIALRPILAIPLAELAPDLLLPGDGRKVHEIADALSPYRMEPLDGYTVALRKDIFPGSEGRPSEPHRATRP